MDLSFFENKEKTEIDYIQEAAQRGTSVIKVMSDYDVTGGIMNDPAKWGKIDYDFLSSKGRKHNVDLIDDDDSMLAKMAINISTLCQFPVSTTYFHGLGVIASAMTLKFSYNFKNFKYPCNIYAVSAQPPGSGKSPMHRHFFNEVMHVTAKFNEDRKKACGSLKRRLSYLQDQLKKSKGNDDEIIDICNKMEEIQSQIDELYPVSFETNTTPAGADDKAAAQDGLFLVVSDEAEAVSVLIGSTYCSNDTAQDFEIFLKAWDGSYFKSNRISRTGRMGDVRATICVCAQDSAVMQLVKTAETGRGVFDRVLIFLEPDIMGSRNHEASIVAQGMDRNVMNEYRSMITEIINTEPREFQFSDAAIRLLAHIQNQFEPHLVRGGIYGEDLWRGTISKAGAQICKIACVFYAVDHVRAGKGYSMEIGEDYIRKAAKFYKKVFDQMYSQVSQHTGSSGDLELRAVYEWLLNQRKKQKTKGLLVIDFKVLYDKIRNRKVFAGIKDDKKAYIESVVIPKAEAANLVVMNRGMVYVNPNLQVVDDD